VVYRAHDTLLDRAVAVKVLSRVLSEAEGDSGLGTEGRARLLREAQAAAKLNHPNIVAVYDAGEADPGSSDGAGGAPFIVMELVEGRSLREYVGTAVELPSQPSALPLADVLAFARQICAALEHAHACGIIHRDLKPENVVLTKTHTAKLMDFGLARIADAPRLTEEGALVGTFSYLAPELIAGGAPSAKSDLYSLGVMLYELAAGRPPFEGETLMAVLAQHLHAPVIPPHEHNPEVPAWLDALIMRLLNKRPEDRPASAGEVLKMLAADSVTASRVADRRVSTTSARHPLPPTNLPAHLSKFIGREKEIAHLKQRLAEYRLMTLTGSGGVGKTRLALEIAERRFPRAIA
jgi:serine/threonine-protein kinase